MQAHVSLGIRVCARASLCVCAHAREKRLCIKRLKRERKSMPKNNGSHGIGMKCLRMSDDCWLERKGSEGSMKD